MFISTAVGRTIVPDSLATNTSPLFWSGNKAHFEGYEFYTVLNGHPVHYAYRYKDGQRAKVFLEKYDKKEDVVKGGFMFARTHTHVNSKGAGEEGDYGRCPHCRQTLDRYGYCISCGFYLDDAIIIGEVEKCPTCGKIEKLCTCAVDEICPMCGDNPCTCFDYDLPEDPERPIEPADPDEPPGGGETPDNKVYYDITVKANTSLGGDVNGGGRYPQDTTITLLAEERFGYDFGGWMNSDTFFNSEEIEVIVTGTKTYTAYFYPEGSECAKLFRDYKNNGNLKNAINLIDSKIMENSKIEYAYAKPQNQNDELFIGNETGVKVQLDPQRKYEYIIHNHPTGKLIPSAADIYKVYIETKKGTFPIGSSFLIITDNGCLSIEVDDINELEILVLNTLSTQKNQKDFDRYLYYSVIGESVDLTTFNATKSVVSYYMDFGLKFNYANIVENTYNWNKMLKNGNDIIIDDCIDI